MRKALIGFIGSISFATVSVADAAYIIKLKNGNEYVTNRYWHEGTQVLFDADGGVFGIDKAFVGKIEKTDKMIKLLTRSETSSVEQPETILKERSNNVTKDAPVAASKTPLTKDENDPVYKEFSALKARSDSLLTMSTAELNEYVQQVVGLISKIQNDRKINQYRQEYSELNALANSLEETIKSRR